MKDGLNRRDLLKLSVASGAAFAAGDLFKSAQGASGIPLSKSEQPTKPADLSSLFQGLESLRAVAQITVACVC